ncbi:Phosphatidate cytidylyltransferase [Tritonibacter multivorans]|uniref:Phosphatidate cytidylyltransferase n=1 Tax=Tritonibacter multivorans TaxID=928856 RepID=A0A0P1GYN0_9RHOB|nr:phosphatidate cytidylyltransferase [Tritonibacter multivorans]MDA7421594.1 phosphatidate cytidylyltransferase [Tritonibacter multivorans]CUH82111.1 Phosphatidate cytidylyltransferase [Tritonibacter multivorans]SFC94490.1 phosphatidate cytidylyltransferase [Tritonibacter multivorans]
MSAAKKGGRWADLGPRTLSAAVLLAFGGSSIHLGGVAFASFVSIATGAVFWELLRMFRKDQDMAPLTAGGLAALAVFVAALVPLWLAPVVLAAPLAYGYSVLRGDHRLFAAYGAWVLLGGFGLVWLRDEYWAGWTWWVIFAVVATDVAGYFVGKYVGGRKFWPAVSPNKTWSGTSGGWAAAAFMGLLFVLLIGMPPDIIWISVFVAMFSQAGDMAESALKRRMGVKDSSQLIPGHGGVFDRFDGILGAGALAFLVAITWG